MQTRTEYEVRYQHDGNANAEGTLYETIEEARKAFDTECIFRDSKPKIVRLVRTECYYEGDECVKVRDVKTIETRIV